MTETQTRVRIEKTKEHEINEHEINEHEISEHESVEPLLSFENVELVYPKTESLALTGLSFELYPGEFVYLAGPSGAGKSSLLRICMGMVKPTSGQVKFLSQRVDLLSGRVLAGLRRRVGVVFQDFKLLEELSVYDNVAFVLRALELPEKLVQHRTYEALELVGLLRERGKLPDELSGGQTQRVAFARAIVPRPQLLLADEPTGNLDEENTQVLVELLETISQGGTSLLVATHNTQVLSETTHRILHLEEGHLVTDLERRSDIAEATSGDDLVLDVIESLESFENET